MKLASKHAHKNAEINTGAPGNAIERVWVELRPQTKAFAKHAMSVGRVPSTPPLGYCSWHLSSLFVGTPDRHGP